MLKANIKYNKRQMKLSKKSFDREPQVIKALPLICRQPRQFTPQGVADTPTDQCCLTSSPSSSTKHYHHYQKIKINNLFYLQQPFLNSGPRGQLRTKQNFIRPAECLLPQKYFLPTFSKFGIGFIFGFLFSALIFFFFSVVNFAFPGQLLVHKRVPKYNII